MYYLCITDQPEMIIVVQWIVSVLCMFKSVVGSNSNTVGWSWVV